jgi:hypothetical protein
MPAFYNADLRKIKLADSLGLGSLEATLGVGKHLSCKVAERLSGKNQLTSPDYACSRENLPHGVDQGMSLEERRQR